MRKTKGSYNEAVFISLYNQGLSQVDIAHRMGVTDGAVYFWRKKLMLPPCGNGTAPRFNSEKVDRIKKLISTGEYRIDSANISDFMFSTLKNIVYRDIDHGTTTRN